MNNELADELEDWYEGNQINDTDPIPQAATMLRQQQAEIEVLKSLVAEQDKKIVELAFRAVYAERTVEIAQDISK